MLAHALPSEVSPQGSLAPIEPILAPAQSVAACDGRCCVAFSLQAGARERLLSRSDSDPDAAFVLEMIVGPLSPEQVAARWEVHGEAYQPPWPYDPESGKEAFACTHWNASTHLCDAYDRRPRMCREYPYGEACAFCGEGGPPTLAEEARIRYVKETNLDGLGVTPPCP